MGKGKLPRSITSPGTLAALVASTSVACGSSASTGPSTSAPSIRVAPSKAHAARPGRGSAAPKAAPAAKPLRVELHLELQGGVTLGGPPPSGPKNAGGFPRVLSIAKRISPNGPQALTDALATIVWYKSDLRSYLTTATGESTLVASLDWTYKRRAADELVQRLAADQDRYRDVLVSLMVDVAALDEFPKLRGVDDETAKVAEAAAAVGELRKYMKPYEEELLDREKARERIGKAKAAAAQQRNFTERLGALKGRYEELAVMDDQGPGASRWSPFCAISLHCLTWTRKPRSR